MHREAKALRALAPIARAHWYQQNQVPVQLSSAKALLCNDTFLTCFDIDPCRKLYEKEVRYKRESEWERKLFYLQVVEDPITEKT